MHELAFSPAAERNKSPIFQVLRRCLPEAGCVLEIGSGTAQHIAYFAARITHLHWQPSEHPNQFERLTLALERTAPSDLIRDPIVLDVARDWPEGRFSAVFSANTSHIMSWPEVERMFQGVAQAVDVGGRFILYGPFDWQDRPMVHSNRKFHLHLQARNPDMGLRSVSALDQLAAQTGMQRIAEIAMPANNHVLVFELNEVHS
ncbi:MAG: DUF938 domain-containing protein [Pseudomonadota bacterium]